MPCVPQWSRASDCGCGFGVFVDVMSHDVSERPDLDRVEDGGLCVIVRFLPKE
jgi:hypothetical protein